MQKLPKDFFAPDTEIVAKSLIGKIIKVWDKYWVITETEAYKHNCDEASHAYGRKTERNKYMYDTYGFVYVYLIYGMHYCLNFTSDKVKPGAVLIRGVREIEMVDWQSKELKGKENLKKIWRKSEETITGNLEIYNDIGVDSLKMGQLISWPWKLTKFFGIDKSFNWLDLEKTDKIQLFDAGIEFKNIKATPRIGISKAKDKLWRFVVE